MTAEVILSPIGLVTQPNKFGQFPNGALSEANGMVIRDPGVLTTYGQWQTFNGGPWSVSQTAMHIIPIPAGYTAKFCVFYQTAGGTWEYALLNASGVQMFGGTASFVNSFRVGPGSPEVISTFSHTFNRGRLIVAFRDSVGVLDLPEMTTPSFRVAGIIGPNIYSNGVQSNGSALKEFTHASVVAVHSRVFSDGYELVSVPSSAIDVRNVNVGAQYNIILGSDYPLGLSSTQSVISLYRTVSQATPTTFPFASLVNCGSEYRLTGKLFPPFASTTVSASDSSLGEYLYTNPGVRGAGAANAMPRPCKCLATFKGHTFYGAFTEPPLVKLRPSVCWADMGYSSGATINARRDGVGRRDGFANITSGSTTCTIVTDGSDTAVDSAVGIVKGQTIYIFASTFFTRTILSISGTTITLSSAAPVTQSTVQWTAEDVVELNGVGYPIGTASSSTLFYTDYSAQNLELISPPSSLNLSYADPQPSDSYIISRAYLGNLASIKTISVRATNGTNWIPQLPTIEGSETPRTVSTSYRGNGIFWSEQNQPEHCPYINVATVGTGEIYAMVPTRDALWIFASDGLWRLSGNGGIAGNPGYDWRIDPVDLTLSLTSRRSWGVLRDVVYALTNRGLVSIDSSGQVKDISQGRIGDWFRGNSFSENNTGTWLVADETHDEVLIVDALNTPTLNTRALIYNTLTDTFSKTEAAPGTLVHGCYSQELETVFVAAVNSTYKPHPAGTAGSASAKFQPIYADDPFTMHRWKRVTYSFNTPAADVTITPLINDVQYAVSTGLVVKSNWGNNQARVSFPVPINAPAVNNCLQVGYAVVASEASSLNGISIDVDPVTRQRKRRESV